MSNTKSCACGSSPGEKGVKGGVKPQSIDGGDLPCMSKVGQAKTWEIRSRGESVTQQERPPVLQEKGLRQSAGRTYVSWAQNYVRKICNFSTLHKVAANIGTTLTL